MSNEDAMPHPELHEIAEIAGQLLEESERIAQIIKSARLKGWDLSYGVSFSVQKIEPWVVDGKITKGKLTDHDALFLRQIAEGFRKAGTED